MILIYTTNKDMEEAKKIANHLLNKNLIACANFFPIESLYKDKDKIENDKEIVSILKTEDKNWETVKAEIKALHSYETPCIIKINAESNKEYAEWLTEELE